MRFNVYRISKNTLSTYYKIQYFPKKQTLNSVNFKKNTKSRSPLSKQKILEAAKKIQLSDKKIGDKRQSPIVKMVD